MPDFVSLLPPNATPLERRLEQVGAAIGNLPTPIRSMWNADACPADLLPWLAWGFGVDVWDSDWSEEQKRAAIKASLFVKKHKGTIGAVTRALAALGYDVTIQEWFNQIPVGAPYTFDVLLDSNQVGIDADALKIIRHLIETYKNLRSHLMRVKPSVTTRGGPVVGGYLKTGVEVVVEQGGLLYPDGTYALDLLTDAALYGDASTIAAIDALHTLATVTLPQANYW